MRLSFSPEDKVVFVSEKEKRGAEGLILSKKHRFSYNDCMLEAQDVRIKNIEKLSTPREIAELYPLSDKDREMILSFRKSVNDIIYGKDRRLLAIVGPCSIHDPKAALEYAQRLKRLSDELSRHFFIVMRTYFEKPRTNLGWKGLILDPDMDGSGDIDKGIMVARKLLIDITEIGLPVGCEVLDPIIPQYIDEIMSWSSIGARTTESQTHRNLASGLSVAVGFKNGTSGDLMSAINAIKSARGEASFIGISKDGLSSVFRTTGNDAGHLILRGGEDGPNYYEDEVENALRLLKDNGLNEAVIIDCSHANSRKDYKRQKRVLRSVIDQVVWGNDKIKGFMLESNICEGAQKIPSDKKDLKYGVSVTDACIGWAESERILRNAAKLLEEAEKAGGVLEVL